MRVIDPKQRERSKKDAKTSKKHPRPVWLFALTVLLTGTSLAVIKLQTSTAPTENNNEVINQNIETKPKTGKLKQFTGQQFSDLYNNFAYPNTAPINENTPITGDHDADVRIKKVAEERGYRQRSAPVSNNFIDVGGGFLFQQKAAQPWIDLVADAKKDGVNIGLTAAYRSAEDQKQLFLSRLVQTGIPVAGIATGYYDAQLSNVLRMTAIPGYSRHHTGYTVDISCEDEPNLSFEYTKCFSWLSANNYEVAKKRGWIPSYPEGAGNQGPDPESWEYVWVGTDAVTE